jgi:hypothetical protein
MAVIVSFRQNPFLTVGYSNCGIWGYTGKEAIWFKRALIQGFFWISIFITTSQNEVYYVQGV